MLHHCRAVRVSACHFYLLVNDEHRHLHTVTGCVEIRCMLIERRKLLKKCNLR